MGVGVAINPDAQPAEFRKSSRGRSLESARPIACVSPPAAGQPLASTGQVIDGPPAARKTSGLAAPPGWLRGRRRKGLRWATGRWLPNWRLHRLQGPLARAPVEAHRIDFRATKLHQPDGTCARSRHVDRGIAARSCGIASRLAASVNRQRGKGSDGEEAREPMSPPPIRDLADSTR